MINAILFDLDGTLLDIDMDQFLHNYLIKLSAHFSPYANPQQFSGNLMASTAAMIRNTDPTKTNSEVFREHFFTWMSHPEDMIISHINAFYQHVFPDLKCISRPCSHTSTIIQTAKALKCPLVLATNPVFPIAAIHHRMTWAGLAKQDFCLVTSYENMHFCKPHKEYYQEIAEIINVAPSECLMIGNNVDDDIVAADLAGMKTYLAEDLLVNKSGKAPKPDFRGSLAELPSFLEKLKQG